MIHQGLIVAVLNLPFNSGIKSADDNNCAKINVYDVVVELFDVVVYCLLIEENSFLTC